MSGLADKRLVVVTGKGGVGKSTVALALGIAAARRGLRTIVCELSGQRQAARAFGLEGAMSPERELQLEDGLFAISIDPRHALEEYLQQRAGRVGDLLGASRAFHGFVAATPGMRELLSVGKVWELAQERRRTRRGLPYDLVILDAPATGHGVGALRTPRTFAEIARVGPIANQAARIDATLSDPAQTAIVAVALPEEMPVNETIELQRALREQLGQPLAAVVVNARYPDRLGPRQARTVAEALPRARTPLVHAALEAALSEHRRASAQAREAARLRKETGIEPLTLPYVVASVLDRDALGQLAERLEAAL